MFHFTKRRIEAHVCICFVALKVYKELERILKQAHIPLSVDNTLSLAKTVTTIQIELPISKETVTKTLIMERHKVIEKLFSDDFWRICEKCYHYLPLTKAPKYSPTFTLNSMFFLLYKRLHLTPAVPVYYRFSL